MANISFRLSLGLLFGIQSCLYAEGQDRIHALIGQQVNLTCYLNSTEGIVTWYYKLDENYFPAIYTCQDNHDAQCEPSNVAIPGLAVHNEFNLQATRSNDTSVLSLTIKKLYEKEINFKCTKLGNNILQKYSVKSIDPRNIVPNCIITSPHSDENGVGSMTLSCEINSGELDVNLTLEGFELNVSDEAPRSSQSVQAKTLYLDAFNNVHNASCKAYFPEIDIMQSCTYPNIIKAQYIVEGNDIIVKCDNKPDVNHWRFYGSDGIEEDIKDRSWIREGGRSLLIRNISDRDIGKVVMCRTKGNDNQTNKGTFGFTVISKMSGDNNKSNSEDPAPTPSAQNAYLVLTLLFLTLWLITTAVFGVMLWCSSKRNESSTSVIASTSRNASEPNRSSSERNTPLFNVRMGARGDPDTSNTNNSANNPVFEPEVNSADENNRNRQSNNESHLYFTLEKSSPSPVNSLPMASTARWGHPDANPASLNDPQSSHWQGYETVGEPNKGPTCSFDLGEYAEVGKHVQGKGPPDIGEYAEVGKHFQGEGPPDIDEYAEVGKHFQGKRPPDLDEYAGVGKHSQGKEPPDLSGRPSIRKKPERKKEKGDDISRLYSKVNK